MLNTVQKIAFIGAGNMAQAIIKGLLGSGVEAQRVWASARSAASRQKIATQFGIQTGGNIETISNADIVVLAAKPQQLEAICAEIRDHIPKGALVISVAAGINCHSLETWMGDVALVRCMPNTPSSIGLGASGLFANTRTNDSQQALAETVLSAVGTTMYVAEEHLIDAVTAVSGSGPAYFFLFIEAMIDAGVKLGLDREAASELAKQTALGAASLASQSELDVPTLRQNVTSPNGTTERAILTFEKHALRQTVGEAMQACAERASELSKELGVK